MRFEYKLNLKFNLTSRCFGCQYAGSNPAPLTSEGGGMEYTGS